jgi:DsbC/DsbD-like thiol-disulfide interchange protein
MLRSTIHFVLALVLSASGPREDSASSSAAARASGGGAPRAVKKEAADQTETKHLTVATSAPAGAVAPGSRVSLVIDVAPKPEMHVYAPEQKELIPISLVLEANRAVKAHAARFPKPEKYKPLDEVQFVYSKPFRIIQDVTVSTTSALLERAKAAGTTLTIKGALKYQACDNSICYAPVTVPVAWTISLKSIGMH